jgi:hypothetical protein
LARNASSSDGAAAAGAIERAPAGKGSAVLTSMDIGGASGRAATSAFGETEVVAEAAFALEVETAESEAEAGVDAGEAKPRPSAAKADGPNGNPKTANNMAATATLTSLPLT